MFRTVIGSLAQTFALALVLNAVAFAAQAEGQFNQADIERQIMQLGWLDGPAMIPIEHAHAEVAVPVGWVGLQAKDATRFLALSEGHDRGKSDAIIANGDLGGFSFLFAETGYMTMADWEDQVHPDDLMEVLQRSADAANRERKPGYPKYFVDGWAELPSLDRERQLAMWAINGHSDQGTQAITAYALKLGRKGVTVVSWFGEPEAFRTAEINLKTGLDQYRHVEGFRYADFDPDVDTVAAMGVGAMAVGMMTGKSGKAAATGFLAAALLFLKKAWFIVLLPLALFWRRIKRLFRGSNPPSA